MSGEDKEEPKRKQKAERSTRTALSDDSNSAAVSPPLRVCRLVEFTCALSEMRLRRSKTQCRQCRQPTELVWESKMIHRAAESSYSFAAAPGVLKEPAGA